MANNFVFNDSLPVAPLKLAALESCKDFASKVDSHIVQFRRNDMEELKRRKADLHYRGYDVDSYLLDFECPRFGTGEAKAVINESVRGRHFCNGRCNELQHSLHCLRLHQSHVTR